MLTFHRDLKEHDSVVAEKTLKGQLALYYMHLARTINEEGEKLGLLSNFVERTALRLQFQPKTLKLQFSMLVRSAAQKGLSMSYLQVTREAQR